MVDMNKIKWLLLKHFTISGDAQIDPDSGVVNVTGDVGLVKIFKVSQLPVNFGMVTGDFYCIINNLKTLQGAPVHVGGDFLCNHNKLTSLQGAPVHVGGTFSLSYNNQLPLLGLLKYPQLEIFEAPEQVATIMKKYEGKGKTYILNCARDLKEAGFVRNARWPI